MRYLITGGCGFLGSNLASEVIQRGDELIVFDNLSRQGAVSNLEWLRGQGAFKFYHADIRIPNDVNRVIEEVKPDYIFHLAGQVAMTTSIANPRLDFETNAYGSFNIIDAVRRFSPYSSILYSSTNKVYGDLNWVNYEESDTRYQAIDYPNGFPEDINLDFQSPYGTSKGAADQYMLDANKIYDIQTVVFRHSSMYGGRQFATYDQGWVGWFCKQALDTKRGTLKEPFTISGNGKQVRDVLHAEDMKNLYFKASQRIENICGEVFNVGGGFENSLSLLELFKLLEKELNVILKYKKLSSRISDQLVFIADNSKAEALINWAPKVDAQSGLKKMINWLRDSENE